MIIHCQVFKNTVSVADYTPSAAETTRSFADDCQRLIGQVVKAAKAADPERTPCYQDGI